jgi:hypothetical protein
MRSISGRVGKIEAARRDKRAQQEFKSYRLMQMICRCQVRESPGIERVRPEHTDPETYCDIQETLAWARGDYAQADRQLRTPLGQKFEALNRVTLTDGEFQRLLDEVVTPDVFTASRLRGTNTFTRDDGTPLNYTLVNIKDWCKNDFEVVNQLRINTDNSHHRYDVILLINGVPVVQIELKTLGINPRRAMEQIVDYKNDPGNGYTRTLLCFIQLFIVSNRDSTPTTSPTTTPATSLQRRRAFLPVYQFATPRQQEDHPPRLFAEPSWPSAPRPDDQPLHGARRQRAESSS